MTPLADEALPFPELVALVTKLDARGVREATAASSPVQRRGRRVLAAPAVVLCWWSTAASALLAFVTAPVLDGWRLELNTSGTQLGATATAWTLVCALVSVVGTVLWVRRRSGARPFAQALLSALDELGDARGAVRVAAGLDTTADDETLRIEVQAGLGAPLGDAASALFAVPDADLEKGLRQLATATASRPPPGERAFILEAAALVLAVVTCGLVFWNNLSGALGL